MALSPNRGQPPGELSATTSGKEVGFAFNFSNGIANAKAGMKARIYFDRSFRPLSFALTSDVAATLTMDGLIKPLGSGAYTSFVGAVVPTLTAATETALTSVVGVWPDWLEGNWIEATILTHTAGVPRLVSMTVWGEWI